MLSGSPARDCCAWEPQSASIEELQLQSISSLLLALRFGLSSLKEPNKDLELLKPMLHVTAALTEWKIYKNFIKAKEKVWNSYYVHNFSCNDILNHLNDSSV